MAHGFLGSWLPGKGVCIVRAQVLGTLVSYVRQTDEGVAAAGVRLLQGLAVRLAPVLDAAAWGALLRALSLASAAEQASLAPSPHARCSALLSM